MVRAACVLAMRMRCGGKGSRPEHTPGSVSLVLTADGYPLTASQPMIINGKEIADRILEQAAADVRCLIDNGVRPHLVSVQVGSNAVSQLYVRNQQKRCRAVGIRYTHLHLDSDADESELIEHVVSLNANRGVTGIILQLPLTSTINARQVQSVIAPEKDVEGVSPRNIGEVLLNCPKLAPCTAAAVVRLLEEHGVAFEGAEAVVVGHSEIVGKPTAMMLMDRLATVTVCHIATRDLAAHTRRADILVSAVGKAGLIKADMIKPGAVVIDVGINQVEICDEQGKPVLDDDGNSKTRLVGDVDFEAARQVAGAITPVPGGVGPMTLALLVRNTTIAAAGANKITL